MISWVPPAIAFQLDAITITWYGIILSGAVLVSYIVATLLAQFHDKRRGTDYGRHIDSLFWWTFAPAFLGARILFIVYHPFYFASHPAEMIAVWNGGLVWHGALIAGLAGSAFYCAWKKIPWLALADIAAPAIALGQAIGRWGNYFNQENYGLPTTLPWGIVIDPLNRIEGYEHFISFHPAFLYESLWNLILFFLLLRLFCQYILGASLPRMGSGLLFSLYFISYSLGRFAIEFLRIDTVPVLFDLRAPQWWSVGIIAAGGILLWFVSKKGSAPLRRE